MKWATVHSNHAIERVRFELTFSEHVPRKVVEAAKKLFELKQAELRFSPVEDQKHILIGAGPLPPTPVGWSSMRFSKPNVIVEAFQFQSEFLIYESTDYRGWAKAKQRFFSVAHDLLKAATAVVDVKAVGLDYTDRFVFRGKPAESTPIDLLQSWLIDAIPQTAMKGELWHWHRGWFDRSSGKTLLYSQHLDAQDGQDFSRNPARSLQMWTRVQQTFATGSFGLDQFIETIDSLHSECLSTFADLLSDDARAVVGLNENLEA